MPSTKTFLLGFVTAYKGNKLWKILKEMGIPDHLTYLLNLYAGQEATARTVRTVRTWNNGLVPNCERNMSNLYIVTLLI